MPIVLIVLTALAVLVIALVTVGGVVARLAAQPPLRVFSLDEAVEFVADHLPDEVTAQLSFDDVRAIVGWQMDFFEAKGVARPATVPDPRDGIELSGVPGPAQIVDEDDALAFVLGQITEAGGLPDAEADFDDAHVALVIDANDRYLVAIGAVGEIVDEPPDPVSP